MASLADIASVVRGLNATAKALRLYPPTSPIPRQSVESACSSLTSLLTVAPSLTLAVGREGFEFRNGGDSVPVGGAELAEDMRSHGVADVLFEIGCSPDELLSFLSAAVTEPSHLPTGLPAALIREGVRRIKPQAVNLVVADAVLQSDDEDADAFLARLASDPQALAAWLSAAAHGDEAAMAEGLREIAGAGSKAGVTDFGMTLAAAFRALDVGSRDAILGLGIDDTVAAGLVGAMTTHLGNDDIGGALTEGLYGKNMLSLSNALAKLPLAEKLQGVLEEVRRMLPGHGHTTKEMDFLQHMLEVRCREEASSPLCLLDSSYEAVAEAARVTAEEIERGAREAGVVQGDAAERSVKTVLTLLDQQRDFDFYCKTLDGLASMVPGLLERGKATLAARIIGELAVREARSTQPWPELTTRLRAALGAATGPRTMSALLASTANADPEGRAAAHDILAHATETSQQALLEAAMASGAEGLAAAESLVGRRVVDMLAAHAPRASAAQLPAMVARLSAETEPRATAALDAVLRRPDAIARREAAAGLGAAGNPNAIRLLGGLLRDADIGVAGDSARALGRVPHAAAAVELSTRLAELDVDGKDFDLAREIIPALARHTSAEATTTLEKLANRKALIKRGHFADVQDLARRALDARGGRR